ARLGGRRAPPPEAPPAGRPEPHPPLDDVLRARHGAPPPPRAARALMPYPWPQLVLALAAYLIGSLSFATILVRLFRGVDVREHGSGNAGATNVLRTAGGNLAVATVALDVLKGTAAVLLMHRVTFDPRWAGL